MIRTSQDTRRWAFYSIGAQMTEETIGWHGPMPRAWLCGGADIPTDWTEGGRYDVSTIVMLDGSREMRRHADCHCGVRYDVDLCSGCPMGCDYRGTV